MGILTQAPPQHRGFAAPWWPRVTEEVTGPQLQSRFLRISGLTVISAGLPMEGEMWIFPVYFEARQR